MARSPAGVTRDPRPVGSRGGRPNRVLAPPASRRAATTSMTSVTEVSGTAPTETDQPASTPTAGWLAMAAVALMATAVAANLAWIFATQGLGGASGVFFERLLALLGGSRVAASVAGLAAGAAGTFLLYAARWQAMLRGPGLAGGARRRVLVARVLLSVAVSAMLVAIPAHGFFYLWAWPVCEEFCGLPALLLLFAAGAVALVTGLAGLVLVGAEADLMIFWVGIPLGIVTILEPWLTLGWMQVPAVGVVLNTTGIAGLLVALVGLVRARPRAAAH